jgi:peptidoglycan hydrolase CwlO-like protein
VQVELAVLLSIVSVVFSIYFGSKNNKRSDTKDIEARVTERTETNYKLDEISRNVTDIKYDISSTKKSVQELSERMASVEATASYANRRIDILEKNASCGKKEDSDE